MATDTSPSLAEYLAALRRRRLLMIRIAVPIVLIAVILALVLPDVYRSNAVFRIVTDRLAESVVQSEEFADQYVFRLAEEVWASPEFKEIVRESVPYPELAEDNAAAIGEVLDNVTVQMTVQTILEPDASRERNINTGFVISYSNPLPDKAQSVAAGIARIFTDLGRGERMTTAENRVKFFAGEAERTSREIAQFEQQLALFKEKNFASLPETAQANISIRARLEQELDNVDREVRGLQQNRIFVAQQLRQAQAGPAVSNLRQLEEEYARVSAVYAENHPDVVTLRRQIEGIRAAGPSTSGNTLQSQLDSQRAALAEARQRYSEDHPDVRRMLRNIELLEARIAAGEPPTANLAGESLLAVQLQTQVNAIDTQIGGLQGRSAELRRRLEQFESNLGSTPEVEREYQAISRGLTTARQQFDQMVAGRLDAEMEVAAIKGGTADRFELISSPNSPRDPSGPNRLAIVILSLVVAAVAALTGVIAAEVMDTSVRGAVDIRRALGVAPLAVVPEIQNSVFWRARSRRLAGLGVFLLVAAPVIYVVLHLVVG